MIRQALVSIALGCAVALSAPAFAAGDSANMADMAGMQHADAAKGAMSHGEVRKIDASAGKLTIKHGPLDNLGMGAMTMVFRVKDPAMLSQVKVGDKIDFVAEQVDGALTVTRLQKQ